MTADFMEIKVAANGMLPPEVYREIHLRAREARGDVVEVGTAHGASAISAALGLAPEYRVETIDKIAGGTRDAWGGIEENRRIIERNLERFGVADRVRLHVGFSTEIAPTLDPGRPVGMLILDADGAIDRDLALFHDRLAPGAPVVIDDCAHRSVAIPRGRGRVVVDHKFRLTASLVELFERLGVLERDRVVKTTWFGRKPVDARPFDVDPDAILAVYRSLTMAEARVESRALSAAAGLFKRHFPRTRQRIKELAGR